LFIEAEVGTVFLTAGGKILEVLVTAGSSTGSQALNIVTTLAVTLEGRTKASSDILLASSSFSWALLVKAVLHGASQILL